MEPSGARGPAPRRGNGTRGGARGARRGWCDGRSAANPQRSGNGCDERRRSRNPPRHGGRAPRPPDMAWATGPGSGSRANAVLEAGSTGHVPASGDLTRERSRRGLSSCGWAFRAACKLHLRNVRSKAIPRAPGSFRALAARQGKGGSDSREGAEGGELGGAIGRQEDACRATRARRRQSRQPGRAGVHGPRRSAGARARERRSGGEGHASGHLRDQVA